MTEKTPDHNSEDSLRPFPADASPVLISSIEKTKNKAESYARDPEKLEKLVNEAQHKSKHISKGPLDALWNYLTAVFRLLKAFQTKAYTDIPWQSIVILVGGIIYFVSPVDLIPDFIPILGLMDDASVLAIVINTLKKDIERFMDWEKKQATKEAETASVEIESNKSRES
ncbi:MAG: YkvA family protein [Verrucomicrobiota bacterium]